MGCELVRELQRIGFDTAPVRSKSGNWRVMVDGEAAKFAFNTLAENKLAGVRRHIVFAAWRPGRARAACSLPVRIGGAPRDVPFDKEGLRPLVPRHNARAATPLYRTDGGVLVRLPRVRRPVVDGIDLATGGLDGKDLAAAEISARRQAW